MAIYEAVGITAAIGAQDIARAKSDLAGIRNGLQRAVDGAINKTLAKAKTMVIHQLAAALTAPASAIRRTPAGTERITVNRASAGAGELRILGRRIGAINFQMKVGPQGVQVRYFREGGAWNLEGRDAFVGVGKPSDSGAGGNRQLFERLPAAAKGRVQTPHYLPNKGKLRQKIGAIKGLSLYSVYKNNSHWSQQLQAFMVGDVKEQLQSQTDRLLGRRKSERTE